MKRFLILLILLAASPCVNIKAQQSKLDSNVPVLRKQVFSEYTPLADVRTYAFDTSSLVAFANGFIVTKEEFMHVFNSAVRKDSSLATKTQFLNDYILGRQKMFEAFEQNLDTSMKFQLDFLTFKQTLITPYLNEGYSRVDAEAMPEVKYALREQYSKMILNRLMAKEIWSKANVESEQRSFFHAHPELYQGQPFEISKTKVVYDYQKQLEGELNTRVQNKFAFKTNEALAKQL